ncbi:hypothetical protein ACJIZ3_012412 [Penstemon smallii]|uniref:Response regulatory domain-containing protein n=1 Tax=Penstemon smallii TaxID=265156 RepID=A0ABD3UN83_9LAMI
MTSSSTPYKEKPHVLVVDNSLADRKLIERLLASSAYKDYCMPGMTGYELLKIVRVIISRCLEGGAQGFMLKPLKQTNVKKLRCHMMKTQPTMQREGLCI